MKTQHGIDFEVIWKRIYGISTEEEDRILDDWLEQNRKNRLFFFRAKKYYEGKSKLNSAAINIDKALKRIWKQTDGGARLWKRVSLVAAAVVLILFLSFLYLSERGWNPQLVNETITTIQPGKNEAMLILNNGLTYQLAPDKNISLDLDGARVNSKGKSLEYRKDKKRNRKAEYNMLQVPLGGEFFVILSDSTKVWLNSGTTLRYPVQFFDNERKVELNGEAFFQVRKTGQPFLVKSGGQIVEVLGTQFNISAYQDDNAVLTTLTEGKIKVFLEGEPSNEQILRPGNQCHFEKKTKTLTQYPVNVNEFASWKDGWFVFNNAELGSMMKTLSRWYNMNVVFENDSARSIRFTGEIRRYDSLNKFLSFIEKTDEVQIAIKDKTVVVE